MNIVKITNKIALVTVFLLMYWVFIFICSTVFGFKVFRENMTEMFLLSIFGIFSILAGAIVLNIMFNLTAIAEKGGTAEIQSKTHYKIVTSCFLGSLLVIFTLLYTGDFLTSKQKEKYLVSSAADLLEEQSEIISRLSAFSFSREYIQKTSQDIKVLSRVEEKFPRVTVIARDRLDGKPLLLGFSNYSGLGKNEEALKENYILSTSSEERKYLHSVFDGDVTDYHFSSNDGRYEVYYPVTTDNGTVVIHLSQHSRYGKIGS
ncbi:hypothetical protein [Motiliproteus sp. MSK22-1]|uniref:hypothetical protein n=1 Tax=Motiliproteus sp. MSK22-1 TaxID=1897630 RepID=UPI000977052C|nr:hypothetical protein [Motiliproteus sp. MSK22-1]OMH39149.1 hypothetical protein BGP75_05490 [Motiliproteus sp. MSK22-1]